MAKRGRPMGSLRPHPAGEREQAMYLLMQEGKSFSDIGKIYGITRERVRQLFHKYFKITAKECARSTLSTIVISERNILRINNVKANTEKRRMRMFGCSDDVVTSIHGKAFTQTGDDKYGPAWDYKQQKRNADLRGIEWCMTLPEWWDIWQESGKYNLRGRCKGEYVMARWGDSGPYEPGNVYICKAEDNIKDIYLYKSENELEKMRIRKGKRKSHCKRGHELSGENLYPGTRMCRVCDRIRQQRNYYKQRAATA